jgi:diaminopimelate epimerase
VTTGRRFYKMSGSGNDFVVFDARTEPPGALGDPEVIRALCARGTGVGADGLVLLEPPDGGTPAASGAGGSAGEADFRMRYFNSDGHPADMCGNAALCITSLASRLGAGAPGGMRFATDTGLLAARMAGELPEIDLPPVRDVRESVSIPLAPGEQRMGYALAGVPHLVVLTDSVDDVDVVSRGRTLRTHPSLRPAGANVNFLARRADGLWSIRTYERGVEGETLACGTGAIGSAVLLRTWGLTGPETTLATRSGRPVTVLLRADGPQLHPTLRGEGRLVFVGELPPL